MNKLIIGCDPDSDKNGFAFYKEGKLTHLSSKDIVNTYKLFERLSLSDKEVVLHIENVNGNRCSSFNWRPQDTKGVKAKKSEGVGKCKQAQVSVERIAEHFGIEIIRHPVSSKWKSQKEKSEFQQITGWTERSNEDTRSAAWFGYQAVLKEGKK